MSKDKGARDLVGEDEMLLADMEGLGNDRVLPLDTRATKDRAKFPLRETVDDLVSAWLAGSNWVAEHLVSVIA